MEQEKMTISVSELNEALLMEEDEELGPEYRPSTENSAGFQTSPPPISTESATSSNESVKLLEAVKAITTIPDQFMSADKKSLLLMQLFKGETGAQAQLESSTSVTIRTYTDDEKLKTSRNWQKWSRMLELDLEGQKLLQFIHEPRAISMTMNTIPVTTAACESSTLHACGEGTLPIIIMYKKIRTLLLLNNVQVVPNTNKLIISVNKFNKQFQATTILNLKTGLIISRRLNRKLTSLLVVNNLYYIQGYISNSLGKVGSTMENRQQENKTTVDIAMTIIEDVTQLDDAEETIQQVVAPVGWHSVAGFAAEKGKAFYLILPASSGNVWHPDALVTRGNEITSFRDNVCTWVGSYLLLSVGILFGDQMDFLFPNLKLS
ncbi:hypothetical protein PGB90_009435 [Kerria lacca]